MPAVTAEALSNIAFIKYWGNRDQALRLPSNPSLSMNLEGLKTVTTVAFEPGLDRDDVTINGQRVVGPAADRVSRQLDLVRALAGSYSAARVESRNTFPSGAGIASSASGFAALTVAAAAAAGLTLTEPHLSALARRGSGSASRSIPSGYAEWNMGTDPGGADSYAVSIAPPDHWDLVDVIAVLSAAHKATGSTEGHGLAESSPFQTARVAGAPTRLDICRTAVLARDFDALAAVVEEDAVAMHAVMMTSRPPLFYWQPLTLAIIQAVPVWRSTGLPVCFTIDAGPNVHCLTPRAHVAEVERQLRRLGVPDVLTAGAGGPARIVT